VTVHIRIAGYQAEQSVHSRAVFCNARSLASWPEDIRSALSAAVSEGSAAQWRFASEEETALRSALEAEGVSITDLDEAARAAFRRAARTVIEQAYSELPQRFSRLLRDVMQ